MRFGYHSVWFSDHVPVTRKPRAEFPTSVKGDSSDVWLREPQM
jgi:hypothetical protein